MEAKFEEIGDSIMLVYLKGRIDLETIEPFVNCLDHLRSFRVIFDMSDLSFVGSNGISVFIDSMKQLLGLNKEGIKFCQVGSEFKRIFSATLAPGIEIHDDVQRARLSFFRPSQPSIPRQDSETSIQGLRDYEDFRPFFQPILINSGSEKVDSGTHGSSVEEEKNPET